MMLVMGDWKVWMGEDCVLLDLGGQWELTC
jgi:hypothetical protein